MNLLLVCAGLLIMLFIIGVNLVALPNNVPQHSPRNLTILYTIETILYEIQLIFVTMKSDFIQQICNLKNIIFDFVLRCYSEVRLYLYI